MIQPVRSIEIAASLVLLSTGIASAQRGGGLPRIVSAPAAPVASGGVMGVPRYAVPTGPTAPRAGNLPRLGSYQTGYRRGFVAGGYKHHFGSFVGYPFWVPVVWPYFDYGYYGTAAYSEAAVESYAPARAPAKLIVVGSGSASGGDALTVETAGDSVRLSWLGANRPVREVKLFVVDSARRELATRSASPSAPVATFEVATLSAPVAFAGVTVTFADGVMTTTTVPYLRR
jgi:hypothetical protein